MANPVINLSYIGLGPTGSGQSIADQTSGPKSKMLFGYGTLTVSSGTFCTTTVAAVNWIDGTASLGKTTVLSFYAVDATGVNAASGSSRYYSVGADSACIVGDSVTVTGFTDTNNNVSAAAVTAVGSNFVDITNASGTKEAGPVQGAQGVYTRGGIPDIVVMNVLTGHAGDTAATVAACNASAASVLSSITAKGAVLTTPNLTTTGDKVTFAFILEFAN